MRLRISILLGVFGSMFLLLSGTIGPLMIETESDDSLGTRSPEYYVDLKTKDGKTTYIRLSGTYEEKLAELKTLGDIDGDGKADMIFADNVVNSNGELNIHIIYGSARNELRSQFESYRASAQGLDAVYNSTIVISNLYPFETPYPDIFYADIDGDCRNDLIFKMKMQKPVLKYDEENGTYFDNISVDTCYILFGGPREAMMGRNSLSSMEHITIACSSENMRIDPTIKVGNFNGDPYEDVIFQFFITQDFDSPKFNGSRILFGGPRAEFPRNFTFESGCRNMIRFGSEGFQDLVVTTCVDFNGDGIDDILCNYNNYSPLDNSTFGKINIFYGNASFDRYQCVDLYNDSRCSFCYPNGSLSLSSPYSGDLNGDGKMDIVIDLCSLYDYNEDSYILFGTNLTGQNNDIRDFDMMRLKKDFETSNEYTETHSYIGYKRTGGKTIPYLRFGDFNGDGISDLMLIDHNYPVENGKDYHIFPFYRYSTVLYIIPGSTNIAKGDLGISRTSTYQIVGDTLYSSLSWNIQCADVDGDGRDEILSSDPDGEYKNSKGQIIGWGNLFILYPGDFDQEKFKVENMQDNTFSICILTTAILIASMVIIVVLIRLRKKALKKLNKKHVK